MGFNTANSIQGKNKDEIYNMFVDLLSERLIKWGEYIRSKRR